MDTNVTRAASTTNFTRQEIEIMWCAIKHYQTFIGDDLKNDNGCPLSVIERKLWNNLDEAQRQDHS